MKKIIILIAVLLSSCMYLEPATSPVESVIFYDQKDNKTMVVLLPGIGDSVKDFAQYGVVKALRNCRADANVLGVEMTFAYYRERLVVKRLFEDVIQPAQEAGIKEIWLAGLSMGGLGSLLYRSEHPGQLAGIIIVAPYLGELDSLQQYLATDEKAVFSDLWKNLEQTAEGKPVIALAYADNDEYVKQQQWLASLIPASQVIAIPGEHKWHTFKKLWPKAITRSGFCKP